MKSGERASLYRELGKLVGADFHFDRSLELLLSQKPGAERRAFLENLQRGLEEGWSIAESVRRLNGDRVGGLELSLIEAGERSGRLAPSMDHLADYFEAQDRGMKQARAAMVYPLVLLHVGVVLPELPAAVASGTNPAMKILTTLLVLWIVLLGGAVLWRWMSARAVTHPGMDDLLNRLPIVGKVRKHWALARFSQVFHSGLLAALRMSECTRMAGEASQSGRMRQGALKAGQLIETGETLSMSLAEGGGFPAMFVNGVATAEESGTLDREMQRWAAAELEGAKTALSRAAAVLPMVGYGLVVVYVVWRIFEMAAGYYSGILKLMEGI
jgi:type II secretory pathway component PulF